MPLDTHVHKRTVGSTLRPAELQLRVGVDRARADSSRAGGRAAAPVRMARLSGARRLARCVLITRFELGTDTATIRDALIRVWGGGIAIPVPGTFPTVADYVAETAWANWDGPPLFVGALVTVDQFGPECRNRSRFSQAIKLC